MHERAPFRLAAVAALYLAYGVALFVLGEPAFGAGTFYWHETLVVAAIAIALLAAARGAAWRPYRRFLRLFAASLALLLVTTVTYGQGLLVLGVEVSDVAYLAFLFCSLIAWSGLALELGVRSPPSRQTLFLFSILMTGLILLFVSFYAPIYGDQLGALAGRVDAAIAALELASVVVGLAVILLGVPTALVVQIFGLTLLAASDMLYTDAGASLVGFAGAEPVWMAGLCMILAGAWVTRSDLGAESATDPEAAIAPSRSGLSTALLALSLGAVLVSALVTLALDYWFHGSHEPSGEPFFLVLFVVLLVVVMVWITDRFDRAVKFVRRYSRRLLGGGLEGPDWRHGERRLDWILEATGLGGFLDALRKSAARLRGDVLFLGPERLNPPPAAPRADQPPSCFIMMPFGLEHSDAVHAILRRVCRDLGVKPVRGDDLFTPTDILDDIWRGITAARFIIADITGRNPNVLYELGMAHTLAKPVLILSRDAEDIPIDLATRRVILYGAAAGGDWHEELAAKATEAIRAMLAAYGDGTREEDESPRARHPSA